MRKYYKKNRAEFLPHGFSSLENYLIKLNSFCIYQASSSVQRAAPEAAASSHTPWIEPVKPAGISK